MTKLFLDNTIMFLVSLRSLTNIIPDNTNSFVNYHIFYMFIYALLPTYRSK